MWRFLADSVAGTSHERSGLPCQDYALATVHVVDGKPFLLIACSDGAGSASHADVGSQTVCRAAIDAISATLDGGQSLAELDRANAVEWFRAARSGIETAAKEYLVEQRQLSCTLLLAVVAKESSLFVQLGDGAIVIETNIDGTTGHAPVFWPQNGEYANTTYFITDAKFDELLQFEFRGESPASIAVFTDGIQSLALNYATQSAHGPFFTPFFRALADSNDPSDLHVPFRKFLASESVNNRTDDDKTLIVAVRCSDHGAS